MESRIFPAVLCAAGVFTGATNALAALVDVNAQSGAGTVVHLAAGTYDVRYVGPAEGGAFTAWNPWGAVNGCNDAGMNCGNGWFMSSAIDFGHGTGQFDRVDGYAWYSLEVPDDNRRYATPEQALLSGQTVPKIFAPLAQAANPAAYVDAPAPWRFTLAQTQDVNFFIYDSPYTDNAGGISLDVTPAPVPLPATVVMLAPALLALRRRRG